MTVIQIVKKYLKENGYGGLCNEARECACDLNNLAPCAQMEEYCEPAYRITKDQMTEDEKEFAECAGWNAIYRPAEDDEE